MVPTQDQIKRTNECLLKLTRELQIPDPAALIGQKFTFHYLDLKGGCCRTSGTITSYDFRESYEGWTLSLNTSVPVFHNGTDVHLSYSTEYPEQGWQLWSWCPDEKRVDDRLPHIKGVLEIT